MALVSAGHLGMSYAELLCCTNFSFQRGASHAHELVGRAMALGYAALAVADECTLAGIVRAHDAVRRLNDTSPSTFRLIVGSQFRFAEEDRIVLLAPDHAAYAQLCALITKARRRSEKGCYSLAREDFASGIGRCIGLWVPGPVPDENSAAWFASLPLASRHFAFTHCLAQDSDRRLEALRALGHRLSVPLTAAGDVHYHERRRRALHDVLTALRLGTTVDRIGRAAFPNGEQHLRPVETLRRLYPPDLLAASLEIAKRCSFSLEELRAHYRYPRELVPQGLTAAQHLRALTEAGLARRWPGGVPQKTRSTVEKELALIAELGYEHYFLTVEELVRFAREDRKILCQGRGSAANSVVCYALGVTEVSPEEAELLFERFVSKERHEPPDIDIDFEHQRREEVIQHVFELYGRERAALSATVITYHTRMAVRDAGKALGLPPDVLDALSKSLHWFDHEQEIPQQLARIGLDPRSRIVRHLRALVSELKGFPRHLSQHVGGFVISEHPLTTLVPVENAAMAGRTVIQWDKTDLESLGLLKVDCLALGMLSALRRSLDLKSRFDGRRFGLEDIPKEDPETYAMLQRGDSVGVFQVESRAQMTMLPRLKPRTFYDLVIQIAIVRPGPIEGGMVHPYLRRREGKEKEDYPRPELRSVLERTYGVPLFQEQVMAIAMVAADFTPGEADQVRRSMGAWQRTGGLDRFRDKLIAGMTGKGYEPEFAERIYRQILGFGSYGFPESHAASFAILAYASSWLRCHEHAAFVAGLLNSQPMGFYAPAQLIADARRNGVVFRPVDVQASDWHCTLERSSEDRAEVRLGLSRVKGLAEAQGLAIEGERRAMPFRDVEDLAHRAKLRRPALGALARAGALASLAGHRRAANWKTLGVEYLPGALAGRSAREPAIPLPPGSEADEIAADYRSLGFTLGRHPLALLRPRLERVRVRRAADLEKLKSGLRVRVAGIVTHRQRPQTASGVVFMSLEDETGISNLIFWPGIQRLHRQAVFSGRMLMVQGELQSESGVIHVIAQKVRDCTAWLSRLRTSSRDFQ